MAKKSRNQKTKYKKRNPAAALLDGLLTLLDRVLEGFAAAVVAVLRGIGWLMAGLPRGLLWLVKRLLLLLAWPLGRLWRLMTGRRNRAQRCLRLTGFEFEEYMAQVLRDNGFRHVEVTVECGDQGVDILAVRGGKTTPSSARIMRGRWAMPPCRRPTRAQNTTAATFRRSSARRCSRLPRGSWPNRPAWSCGTANGSRT